MIGVYSSVMHESLHVTPVQAASITALKNALEAIFAASKSAILISWNWIYNPITLQYEGLLVWATNFQREKAVY